MLTDGEDERQMNINMDILRTVTTLYSYVGKLFINRLGGRDW